MYLTLQEIYDTSMTHLANQGVRSLENPCDPTCLYRGPNGTKCAIGCLIADELYDLAIESKSVGNLIDQWPHMLPNIDGNDVGTMGLLRALQSFHDRAATWYSPVIFRADARAIAADYGGGLDTTVLDSLDLSKIGANN